ncbi:MAG: hypothetical protein ACHQDC_02575 [Acidimicrobiales bacterium]
MTTASVLICHEASLDGDLVATHHAILEEHQSRPVWMLHDLQPTGAGHAGAVRWVPSTPDSFLETLLAMVAVGVLDTPSPDALREDFVDLEGDPAVRTAVAQLGSLAAVTLSNESLHLLVTLIDSSHLAEQVDGLEDGHPRVAIYRGSRPRSASGGWSSAQQA